MRSQIRITHICRQEDKCYGAGNSKPIKDHNEEAVKVENSNEEEEEEGKSGIYKNLRKQDYLVSDTAETHSIDAISENVLKKVVKLHVRHSSRSKHHKSKTRHHKDKRKKRRHSRNGIEDTCTGSQESERIDENASNAQNGSVESEDSSNRETMMASSESNAKSKLVESSEINRSKDIESATTKTDVGSVRYISDVNNTTSSDNTRCNAKAKDGTSGKSTRNVLEDSKIVNLQLGDATSSVPKRACNTEASNKDVDYSNPVFSASDPAEAQIADAQDADAQVADESEKKSRTNTSRHAESQKHKNATSENASKNGESKDVENRKLKKKRKRPRHDAQVREKNAANDTAKNNASDDETVSKHRRKKHKHTNDHRVRKCHDVRKAPQDGIVKEENHAQDAQLPEGESESSTGGSGKTDEDDKESGVMTEPQRLAIKIKLCQECNSRHLQDACPLTMPQYTIVDTITYDQWLNKHKKNAEVMKAVRSVDPMSEGYGRPTDDNFESDDESLTSGEQCKSKSKVQREEKQLVVDADRPLYARDSLPDCFELKITNTDHGLGIFAKKPVPMYAKLGPLVGTPVREMDIPDDFSMRHIWEVLSFL